MTDTVKKNKITFVTWTRYWAWPLWNAVKTNTFRAFISKPKTNSVYCCRLFIVAAHHFSLYKFVFVLRNPVICLWWKSIYNYLLNNCVKVCFWKASNHFIYMYAILSCACTFYDLLRRVFEHESNLKKTHNCFYI